MPKQKAPIGAASAAAASSSTEINDSRFLNFTTDPRFRLPSKKHTRTKIDKRFSRMLKDEDFSNTARVDRYGRKLSSEGKKKALERLYVPDEEEEEEEEDKEAEDVEVEDDDVVEKELNRANSGYDAARGGGFSSSSEDEDEEHEEEGGVAIEEAEFPDMHAEQAGVEMGEVSPRFAVVNLDWDNIRSSDLMAVFNSFIQPGGKIYKISIYPSEFGKERMEHEELEGPPKEIFSKKQEDEEEAWDSEDSEESEVADEKIKKDLLKEDDGQDFDGAALRQYQLERLRYYYAVVVCSDAATAEKVYTATDGTEYLSSANFFDLRFIPDGVDFDDNPRDECDAVPEGYRPTEFVTDALQHSKVKLTWDMNPEEATRKDAINRAFSGSRAEIGENDLRAYLGSDSEDETEEAFTTEEGAEEEKLLTKKELARQKMRAALGLSEDPAPSSKKSKKDKAPVGDMEITFTSGFTPSGTGVFENDPVVATETTAEKYIRKEKERKARRKAQAKTKRDPDDVATGEADENFTEEKEDLGFDDPFFSTDVATKSSKEKPTKEARRLRKEAKVVEAAAKATERANLELLMQPTTSSELAASAVSHFDINEIARVEKRKNKKKGKHNKEGESKRGGLQEGFEMDVKDPRFAGRLFGEHEFAIDPSNPRFKGTEGMKMLLEEGRRNRDGEGDMIKKEKKRKVSEGDSKGLSSLVESVKKKSKK